MPDDALDPLEARLERVEEGLRAVEARVKQLERPAPPPAVATHDEVEHRVVAFDATLIARAVLIVGGAYALRAMTELGVIADSTGVVMALLYVLFWMWAADRAMSRGAPMVALFDAGTAAMIGGALIWEATTRFHLLTVWIASALVIIVSLSLSLIAWRRRSVAMAMISSLMSSVTCIGLAVGTADPAGPALAAALIGVVMSSLSIRSSWPLYPTLVIAAASDSLVLPLIVMTAVRDKREDLAIVESILVAFAALWLVVPLVLRMRRADGKARVPDLAQAVVATFIGLGGAALVAGVHGGDILAVSVGCLLISAATFTVALMLPRLEAAGPAETFLIVGAIAGSLGSLLVMESSTLAIVWSLASAGSSAIGRRFSWSSLNVHAAFWSLAAAIAAGLPAGLFATLLASRATAVPTPAPLIVVAVLASLALSVAPAPGRRSRLLLLTIVAATFIVITLSLVPAAERATLAMVRTAIIVITAIALFMIDRWLNEARTLWRALLVIAGVKLLAEDLRVGRAVTIVMALALYGAALLIVARRSAAAESKSR